MDLIRREKAINSVYDGTSYDILTEECKRHIEEVPSAFEGMTYGEVIKAVLGIKDEQIAYGEYVNVIRLKRDPDSFMSFDSKVWDSPYKGVSE